jgi:demethylmenaquinone methyltransferase/2-methoxy-6-polyprenyl-1,4-benzoquinol methylase
MAGIPSHQMTSMRLYFDCASASYQQAIEPAFGPLAKGLVRYARLLPHETVIDLGTGSGLAASYAQQQGNEVAALDLSLAMLKVARRHKLTALCQADMHHLPIRSGSFDVVLASFAFNSTDPALSLREAWRILKPGGRLVLQEWGTPDPLSELVTDTLAEYAPEDVPPTLAAMRQNVYTSLPWDELKDSNDLRSALREAGFSRVRVNVVSPSVSLQSVEVFLRYKLAWPIRRAELEAMPEDVRQLCLNDLRENIAAHCDSTGRLIWRPNLVRLRAFK